MGGVKMFKKLGFSVLLLAMLTFVVANYADAGKGEGGGAPDGGHFSGKAIVGRLILDGVNAEFVGRCGNSDIDICIPFGIQDLANLTADDLLHFEQNVGNALDGCIPNADASPKTAVVQSVANFSNDGIGPVTANVVWLFVL